MGKQTESAKIQNKSNVYIKKEEEGNSFKKEMGEQENPLLKKFETHKSHMPRERESIWNSGDQVN